MFDIRFTSASHDELTRQGRITLGSFSEIFVAPLGFWVASDYERQWCEAAERLARGEERSGFFTMMYDTNAANFLGWWPAWRIGNQVRVQNQFLFLNELDGCFDERGYG
jgi:hypothetical protein